MGLPRAIAAGIFSATILSATILVASAGVADSWKSEPNMGRQGIQGALTRSDQGGTFDLDFDCSARAGENRTVFMTLQTPPDAPLAPGNETSFPITLRYTFTDGSTQTSEVQVDWSYSRSGVNVWKASFAMDKTFLSNFARARTLALFTYTRELIFQYDMSASAKAAKALVDYCYSGDYS